ncbi:hypothetical protein [Pedobacter sp. CFBP9032]|nr:hypothetical protein [Pedobacter sp. CFBP9032]MDY0903763.1 hypothetical protein [Pedobacter sp. CFBP9032]
MQRKKRKARQAGVRNRKFYKYEKWYLTTKNTKEKAQSTPSRSSE